MVEIVKQKMDKGSSADEALQTTFGVDIMGDNVHESRKRLLALTKGNYVQIVEKNITQGNFLEI